MSILDEQQALARAILVALFPVPAAGRLDEIIRTELLVASLQGPRCPRTLVELWVALEYLSAGDVDAALLDEVRARAEREPELLLGDLARRAR
jgi:hypothetical protein